MNWLDPIEELYNMYSEEEDTPRIVEVGNDDLDFDLDIEGITNGYLLVLWLTWRVFTRVELIEQS